MWDNFIGKQIRRCNRNLLIANLVLLGLVISYATINARYLTNFLSGSNRNLQQRTRWSARSNRTIQIHCAGAWRPFVRHWDSVH